MQQSVHCGAHPRRQPAHLSVTLKHGGGPKPSGHLISARDARPREKYRLSSKSYPTRQSSSESNDSSAANVERWFDRSSKQPPNVELPDVEDDIKSPCFIPATVSAQSNVPETNQRLHPSYTQFRDHAFHAVTTNSSADDYRSVIDDLTIENKKLKEKLRKYERLHSTHLEKDKLFEVKIHALPAAKRRDLEDTLRNFASRIGGSRDEAPRGKPKPTDTELPTPDSDIKDRASGSSNSRPGDSGYASMPNSGPTSTATQNTGALDKGPKPPTQLTKEQNVQSFLQDIPEGLLPKHSVVMTERQKKKLVVKRLEQLFTGKVKGFIASHNQTLQQQEVSRSAERDDQAGDSRPAEEGLREANILPNQMDVDDLGPAGLSNQYSQDTVSSSSSVSDVYGLNLVSSPDQRPTRPLDLDPDREQIPLDNMEYLHHLGVSRTQLVSEDSSDAEPEADGWIFLNLLINMAQLHIMNVTPDFVRSAVSDVSAKFQLSKDGQKIRWRGGKEGTRLSSDSDNSSPRGKRQLGNDSDSGIEQKRQKLDVQPGHNGQFASVPFIHQDLVPSINPPALDKSFHYKPLFFRAKSSNNSMSHRGSSSYQGYSTSEVSEKTGLSYGVRGGHQRSGSSSSRRRTDDGPIAFYSGAKFCTDLSSDRTNILTPLHNTGVGKDGYSNHTEDALGCVPLRPTSTFSRSTSGSLIRSRPFKDYSIDDSLRKSSPELVIGKEDAIEDQSLNLNLEWSSKPLPTPLLLDLSASGLGGTQPADHFVYSILTRRTKLGSFSAAKLSRSLRRNTISSATLNLFHNPKNRHMTDDITTRLASMSALSSLPKQISRLDLPVRVDIVDTKFYRLQPSQLPEPSGYYEVMSTTDDDSSSDDSSSSGLAQYRQPILVNHWPLATISNPDVDSPDAEASGETSESYEDEDSDSSIDMLAQLRAVNPLAVAAQEAEFEMAIDQPGSSAATLGEHSVPSSTDDSDGGDSDDSSE